MIRLLNLLAVAGLVASAIYAYSIKYDTLYQGAQVSKLQTALLNAPLVVLVGWGQGIPMGLDFEIFDIAMLILAIVTVGNFLRDQKSNYLEGFLSVTVYVAIAIAAFNYPRTKHHGAATAATAGGEGGGGH